MSPREVSGPLGRFCPWARRAGPGDGRVRRSVSVEGAQPLASILLCNGAMTKSSPSHGSRVADRFLQDMAQSLSSQELRCPTFVDASLGARFALKNPNLSTADLARVVAGEPVLSARVVALANSAAIRRGGKRITDVRSAVTQVGQNAVRNIAVTLALQQMAYAKELQAFRVQAEQIWAHSLEVAVIGHVLARYHGKTNPDEALFAGLVHDLGHFYAMWRAAQFPELAGHPDEVRALAHDTHAAAGVALLRSLKLAETVILAVSEHERDPATLAPASLSRLLSIANRCANTPSPPPPEGAADLPVLDPRVGLDEPTARALLDEHFDDVIWLLAVMKGQ
jgi:putative nucleotidyltransferase with HDIG domain